MNHSKTLQGFTNLYPLSKTLRFELVPMGNTKENIEKNNLLSNDKKRAVSYQKVKEIIDNYHKDFIEKALANTKLDLLSDFAELYYKTNKDDADKNNIKSMQDSLRKQIVSGFIKNENKDIEAIYKNLFSKELIKIDLLAWTKSDEEKMLVQEFKDFTTYFTGFHENRKNMYSADDKSTAIAYRVIHDNLPKFLDNLKVYQMVKEKNVDITAINKELESVLQGTETDEVFSIEYFNEILSQNGIEFYNTVLGGRSDDGKKKLKGLNEYINLFNQKQEKKNRIPRLKPLFKQILSDRETSSFIIDEFKDDDELLENLEKFYSSELLNYEADGNTHNIFQMVTALFDNTNAYDKNKIFLRNDTSLTQISQYIFGDWALIANALSEWYDKNNPMKNNEKIDNYEKRKKTWLKKDFSIAFIETALKEYENEIVKEKFKEDIIFLYFKNFKDSKSETNILTRIETAYNSVRELLNINYDATKKLATQKNDVAKIKAFLDAVLDLIHFIKPLSLNDATVDKDELFYSFYIPLFEQLNKTIPVYNKVRNYLTKKPFSTEKIKLNFENSTLLHGWDLNKEDANNSVILIKDNLYYLGIMDKKHNKIFKDIPVSQNGPFYKKMVYKLLPGANKMLPKVFFSKSRIEEFSPSENLVSNYKAGTHKKGDNFSIKACHELIDFFKKSITKHEDWKSFNHNFSKTSSYNDLSDFYREVEKQGYKISYQDIPESYINKLVEEGKLYLFQIYNKDFSPFSKGKPNMHTLYWKMLFDPKNLESIVYKLNGQAEVFFRKASIKKGDTTIHKAGEAIVNKNPDNAKKNSSFDYDIIKNKRYTLDKFQFHVPITMNFRAEGKLNINGDVSAFLKNNPAVNIIGLDRGERHLIYLTLINQKGEILLQESLNTIINPTQKVDYHKLLDKKEKERDAARKNWGLIENIKELKEGYISQVVHKIASLMVKHNAIVVMEDLNFGFKRGRQKVEKQVYQKFEKMLIDKLNYLVFKDMKTEEAGGLLNALQLSNKFESFKKMGKQNGFIFYVPASNTSKIDPATGFVNMLYTKYESVAKAQDFFSRFEEIRYNPSKDYFEFAFDYNSFHQRAAGTQSFWTVCTHGDTRYRYNPQTKSSEEVNVTKELKQLLKSHNIDYSTGSSFQKEIVGNNEKSFHAGLLHLLGLTLSLRHAKSGTDIDYILSPVADADGNFFDSRKASDKYPKDADANGAYHVALKGLWVLETINKAENLNKLKLAISNKEWLAFAQKK